MERRAQGIAPVAGAEDAPPGLAQDGIIHGHYQRMVRSAALFDLGAHVSENLLHLQAVFGLKAVIGGPVLLGAILVAQQAGDGVPAKTHQLGKTVAAAAGKRLRCGEAIGRLLDQALDFFEEGSVFFRSMGLGGT
jgi:hypothetical protein